MNREQKIALIIGFAVILVVGVLVSDHLSRARQLQLADATEGDATRYTQMPVVVLNDPAEAVPREVEEFEPAAPPRQSRPPERLAPVVITQETVRGSDSPLGEALSRGGPADEGRVHLFPEGLPVAAGVSERRESEPERVEVPRTDPGPVAAPEPIRHTVRKNESLFVIAKRHYGDGNKWRVIADANPGKVGPEGQVREGRVLDVPPLDGAARAEGVRAGGEPEREEAAPSTYTVRKNDTLGEIAQRELGSAKRMGEIMLANASKISDPDDIFVGMKLRIPPR